MGNLMDSPTPGDEEREDFDYAQNGNITKSIIMIGGAIAIGYYWGNRSAKKYTF